MGCTRSMTIETERALNKLRWKKIIGENESAEKEESTLVNVSDDGKKKVNINNLKCTELPFNPNVAMPHSVSFSEEVKYHQFKEDVKTISEKYKKKTQDMSNLTAEERTGLKALKKKVTDTSIVCYQTDKSGRWSCDTKDNYKEACKKHLSDPTKTEVISVQEHEDAEREMNCHAYALLRMMGIKDENNGGRIRKAMRSSNNALAPFYCLRKDHKKVEEGHETEGPKTRPLCGATDCLTRRTSFLLSKLLVELIPPSSTQCNSTQELIEDINELNKKTINDKWIVCSLDVEALYPSLDIEECARVIEEQLFQADFEVDGLRWTEIALYLKYHLTDEEIDEMRWTEYFPIRATNIGRPPKFVASGSDPDIEKRLGPWKYANIEPSDEDKKKMFCRAIKVMIEKTMSLHDYVFDGEIIRQKGGGSIGLDLTGVVSDIYMNHWDKIFLQKLLEKNIIAHLYKRYKDDIRSDFREQERRRQNAEGERSQHPERMYEYSRWYPQKYKSHRRYSNQL